MNRIFPDVTSSRKPDEIASSARNTFLTQTQQTRTVRSQDTTTCTRTTGICGMRVSPFHPVTNYLKIEFRWPAKKARSLRLTNHSLREDPETMLGFRRRAIGERICVLRIINNIGYPPCLCLLPLSLRLACGWWTEALILFSTGTTRNIVFKPITCVKSYCYRLAFP